MNFRNAVYKNPDRTVIDLEIEHPDYGWIPYTFCTDTPDDSYDEEVRKYLKNVEIGVYTKTEEQLGFERKLEIENQLSVLKVASSKGNVFDANMVARQNMADAILASDTLGITQTVWRMADNSEVLINISELREAHALAIQAYARIKMIGA